VVGGRYFRVVAVVTATLACACGLGEGGVAAVRHFRRPTLLQEWGPLDEAGGWTPECVEEVETDEEEPGRTAVYCPACVAAADGADWAVRAGAAAEDRFGQSPFVACNACGTEHLVV
jgi:hypothetical protein